MTTIDPTSSATQFAQAFIQPMQTQINNQTQSAKATSDALTSLQSALQTFDSALFSLSGTTGVVQYSATVNDTSIATATATSSAQAGSYSFFVEQTAAAHQVAFNNVPSVPIPSGGPLVVQLNDGTSFTVDLTAADTNGDGSLSPTEVARAINEAQDNSGKVNAAVMTVGGQSKLVLTSASTGADGQITLDTSGLPASGLKNALDNGQVLVQGRDAIAWLGDQGTGIQIQQASNTFTGIDGVSITFTKAQQAGATPITLTVARDDSSTATNVRGLVDAYNTLKKTLDDLTANATPDKKAGAFANDSGVRALRDRINSLIRQKIGGVELADFGISASRSGTLALDTSKLSAGMNTHPGSLDQLFGKAAVVNGTGVLGTLDQYLKSWTSSVNGQISQRQTSLQKMQDSINTRQSRLDTQYTNTYNRYLKQFTQLASLQDQMSKNTSIFDSLNSSSSSSS